MELKDLLVSGSNCGTFSKLFFILICYYFVTYLFLSLKYNTRTINIFFCFCYQLMINAMQIKAKFSFLHGQLYTIVPEKSQINFNVFFKSSDKSVCSFTSLNVAISIL